MTSLGWWCAAYGPSIDSDNVAVWWCQRARVMSRDGSAVLPAWGQLASLSYGVTASHTHPPTNYTAQKTCTIVHSSDGTSSVHSHGCLLRGLRCCGGPSQCHHAKWCIVAASCSYLLVLVDSCTTWSPHVICRMQHLFSIRRPTSGIHGLHPGSKHDNYKF